MLYWVLPSFQPWCAHRRSPNAVATICPARCHCFLSCRPTRTSVVSWAASACWSMQCHQGVNPRPYERSRSCCSSTNTPHPSTPHPYPTSPPRAQQRYHQCRSSSSSRVRCHSSSSCQCWRRLWGIWVRWSVVWLGGRSVYAATTLLAGCSSGPAAGRGEGVSCFGEHWRGGGLPVICGVAWG